MTAVRSFQALVLAALLGGCMIPQPDTPPIGPPGIDWGRNAAPAKATAPPTAPPAAPSAPPSAEATAGSLPAGPSPTSDTALRLATRLLGRIVGATATRITAVPTQGELPGVLVTPDADGTFALELAGGGSYRIELTIDGKTVVATPAIMLAEDGEKRVVITVEGDPPAAAIKPAE